MLGCILHHFPEDYTTKQSHQGLHLSAPLEYLKISSIDFEYHVVCQLDFSQQFELDEFGDYFVMMGS